MSQHRFTSTFWIFLILLLMVGTVHSRKSSSFKELSDRSDCKKGKPRCVDMLIEEMKERLERLGCHHSAVFLLTYIRTEEILVPTSNDIPYDDLSSIIRESGLFADYYFRAYDAYFNKKQSSSSSRSLKKRGKKSKSRGDDDDADAALPPPPAWQIAFQAADDKSVLSLGNLLLDLNAHVTNDLPQVLFDLYLQGTPVSELDHFLVYDWLEQLVFEEEMRALYDPNFPITPPPPPGQPSPVEVWRGTAWLNYLALVAASEESEEAVEVVRAGIEEASAAAAMSFLAAFAIPPGADSTVRDEYCAEQQNGGSGDV